MISLCLTLIFVSCPVPVTRGQEDWPRLRSGTYGQRLRPLSANTTVPRVLPLDCNHPEESREKGGNAQHKYIASTPCYELFLDVDGPVLYQGPSLASSSVPLLPLQPCMARNARLPHVSGKLGAVPQPWRTLICGVSLSGLDTRYAQED